MMSLGNPTILMAIAVSGLAVLILAFELFFRIRYRDLLWIQVYPRLYVPDDDLGYRYLPSSEGEIRIPGIHRRFRTNSHGFHAREYTQSKVPGVFRIAVVGTSNTTGIWMNGTGHNFCELLDKLLKEAGYSAEVLNFGIDGRFRAVHELRIVETDVLACNPDLVLMDVDIPFIYGSFRRAVYKGYVMIYNCETELSREWCEAVIDAARDQRILIAMYYASYIVRAAVRYYINRRQTVRAMRLRVFVERRVQAPDIVLLPYSLKKSIAALQGARDSLAAQGGELVIFQYSPNPYYREVLAKYSLAYVELNVPPTGQYVHDRDGHYRQEGHAEVAQQLFNQLTALGTFARLPTSMRQAAQ